MKQIEMDKVFLDEVIISTQNRRGTGKDILSPIRVITEVFDKSGEKIAEHDPCAGADTFAKMDLVHFAQWCFDAVHFKTEITHTDVRRWLDEIERGQGI